MPIFDQYLASVDTRAYILTTSAYMYPRLKNIFVKYSLESVISNSSSSSSVNLPSAQGSSFIKTVLKPQ